MSASLTFVWHGLSCFSIEAKNGDAVANLVTDPFSADSGLKLPRNLSADVVAVSNAHALENVDAVKPMGEKKIFVIKNPGEYEVGGLFVYGMPTEETTLFRFEIGDLSVAHLGHLKAPLDDKSREQLEDVDILLVPVGGESVMSAKQAVEIVTELEPRVVIPMHYSVPGLKVKCDAVDKFLKEIAAKAPERTAKLRVMKKDLPAEETKVIILEKD